MSFGKRWLLRMAAIAVLLAAAGAAAASPSAVIKVALLTPEGSAWTEALKQMASEVNEATAGEVGFKIYAGGISGDEADVLRKMRVKQIHAAGFSGVGLGMLLPSIRILEAPLLFRSYAEVDHVKTRLFEEFAAGLSRKGYVLLGFAEAGFVNFFAQRDISTLQGLLNVKMWSWKDDPIAEQLLKAFDIQTHPLHPVDVITSLETGLIDAFYAPPLAAIAFQWYPRISYMLDYPMVNSTGALILRKDIFESLTPRSRGILQKSARRYCAELVRLSRQGNQDARRVLQKNGVRFVSPAQPLLDHLEKSAAQARRTHLTRIYSRQLYERVLDILHEYRNQP
jgi:TRAP-type C4-dicarboxylate transport system substrate-binding protein